MIFKIEEIIPAAKKELEESTGVKFETPINFDKRKKNPDNYYFLCNDELDIEVCIGFAKVNFSISRDFIDCRIQKPYSKVEQFDFRSIYGGDKCKTYIVETVKTLLLKK